MTTSRVRTRRPVLPGPPPMPLAGWKGNMLAFGLEPVSYMLKLFESYGPIVGVSEGEQKIVFVFGGEYLSEVLTKTDVFYVMDEERSPYKTGDSAQTRMASGLGAMNGDQHERQRRLMLPSFHKKRIEAYRDDIVAQTLAAIAGWRPGEQRDMHQEIKELTMAIVVKELLGLDPEQEGKTFGVLMERWLTTGLSFGTLALPLMIPGLPYYKTMKTAEALERQIKEVIARKRASGVDGGDVLSMMLAARDEDGGRMSDEELLGQVATLFIAGHGTSANALAWTLFLLDQHPQVFADLVDEMDSVLRGEPPTVEQLGQLPFLDRVLNESLRLMPSSPWFMRAVVKPYDLGSYHLKEGSYVIWSPAVTNRNSAVFDNPHHFMPQRWESLKPGPYDFIPFGAGPRRCLGATFALMEMKLVLATILQRYRVELPEGIRINRGGLAMSYPKAVPAGGLPMNLWRQDRRFEKRYIRGNIRKLINLN